MNDGEPPQAAKQAGQMSVVTISRQYGAGGKRVGRALADALGYRFVEGEIVEEAARQLGLDPDLAEHLDERVPDLIEETGLALASAVPEMAWTPLPLDDRVLAERVKSVIVSLGVSGNCVIMGRGGQVVLRDTACHLQIVSPFDDRVKRIAEWHGVSTRDAVEICKRADSERTAYIRRFYDVDVRDPLLYHAVLNTSRLGIDGAVRAALEVIRAAW